MELEICDPKGNVLMKTNKSYVQKRENPVLVPNIEIWGYFQDPTDF